MNTKRLLIICLALPAFAWAGSAVAADPHPVTVGCPADFPAITSLANAMTLSDQKPTGVFAYEYLGKVKILGHVSESLRVSRALPVIVGFRLPPAYKEALAQRNMECKVSDGCATTISEWPSNGVVRAMIRPENDGSWELWCHYSTYSLGELGRENPAARSTGSVATAESTSSPASVKPAEIQIEEYKGKSWRDSKGDYRCRRPDGSLGVIKKLESSAAGPSGEKTRRICL